MNTTTTVKEDVAAAMAISLAMWRDATPTVKFPSMTEMAKIELGRLLSIPLKHPELRRAISPHMQCEFMKPPWHAPDPADLLDAFVKDIRGDAYTHYLIGKEIMAQAHAGDPAYAMICRRGLPPTYRIHDFEKMTKDIARVFKIPWKVSIREAASQKYFSLYQNLVSVP